MRPSLLIVAHGSSTYRNAASPVFRAAEQIDSDDVSVGFWKQEPFLHDALSQARTDTVVVIPFFLANGYFVQTIVPREFELDLLPRPFGKKVVITNPIGVIPNFLDAIKQEVDARIDDWDNAAAPRVLVVGHGTPRHKASRDSAIALADLFVQDQRRCTVAFVDDEPALDDVLVENSAPLVVVPFFVGPGLHATEDVQAFATQFPDDQILVTPCVGEFAGVVDVIQQTYDDACVGLTSQSTQPVRTIRETPFEISNSAISSGDGSRKRSTSDIARGLDSHRPLRTALPLENDWTIETNDANRCIEELLPGFQTLPAALENESITINDWATTADRQSGFFASVKNASADVLKSSVQNTCGACLRTPIWYTTTSAEFPCRRACPILLSEVKKQNR